MWALHMKNADFRAYHPADDRNKRNSGAFVQPPAVSRPGMEAHAVRDRMRDLPRFSDQLVDEAGGFAFCVDVHEMVEAEVKNLYPVVAPAPTRVSDPAGGFFRQSSNGSACMFVQVGASG